MHQNLNILSSSLISLQEIPNVSPACVLAYIVPIGNPVTLSMEGRARKRERRSRALSHPRVLFTDGKMMESVTGLPIGIISLLEREMSARLTRVPKRRSWLAACLI